MEGLADTSHYVERERRARRRDARGLQRRSCRLLLGAHIYDGGVQLPDLVRRPWVVRHGSAPNCAGDPTQHGQGMKMMRWLHTITLLLCAAVATTSEISAQEPAIGQLDWLIGEWTFEDVEIDGEYRETGTRVCEYALGGEYIVCESNGVNHLGRERDYLWYFNYNDRDQRFEVTSLLQGYPGKLLYTATIHDGGRRLELAYGAWEGDQVLVEGGATVAYNGSDRYVWGNDRYRDVATRR